MVIKVVGSWVKVVTDENAGCGLSANPAFPIIKAPAKPGLQVERETRFELATSTLARVHHASTSLGNFNDFK